MLRFLSLLLLPAVFLLAACTGNPAGPATTTLTLPELTAVELSGRPLQVVATTSIIGDVVQQVGGEAIALTTLMAAGQDPHGYVPPAGDLAAAADADVIFIHGWQLEESLLDNLQAVAEDVPLVPVAAGIEPRRPDEQESAHADEEAHDHGLIDPHTWMDPQRVGQWVKNIATALSALDPANRATYEQNAAAYQQALAELDAELAAQFAQIPAGRRLLVTNHNSLGYLAERYDFELLGTILPGASTLAEPSAANLSELVEAMSTAGVCTVFAETTAADTLARTVAAELSTCDEVKIVPLYTGALGPAGSGADSYLGMMRANAAAIVQGLQ